MKFSPFADKINDAKRIFKRVHGAQYEVEIGENVLEFAVPYDHCKITGLEFIGSQDLETASLEVLDSETGVISGVPNLKLNQFGFTVNLTDEKYVSESNYCADLYGGMKIKITYNSKATKVVGLNFILHEVKE